MSTRGSSVFRYERATYSLQSTCLASLVSADKRSVQRTDRSKWTYRHRRRRRGRRRVGVASGRHRPHPRRRASASAVSGAMASSQRRHHGLQLLNLVHGCCRRLAQLLDRKVKTRTSAAPSESAGVSSRDTVRVSCKWIRCQTPCFSFSCFSLSDYTAADQTSTTGPNSLLYYQQYAEKCLQSLNVYALFAALMMR